MRPDNCSRPLAKTPYTTCLPLVETPMIGPKRDGLYEVGHSINIHSKMDELSQKLDWLLQVGQTSITSTHVQDVCTICSSPTYFMGDCPVVHQFPEFVQEQIYQVQTQTASRLDNNPYSNTYNLDWRNHPNFSWKLQPMVHQINPLDMNMELVTHIWWH